MCVMNYSPEIIWSCVIIGVISCLYYYVSRIKYWSQLSKIPGPKPLPIIGNILEFFIEHSELINVLIKLSDEYPKYFTFWMFHYPYVFLFNASDIETVLSSTTHNDKSKDYNFLQPWLGTGLLTSNGSKWHKRRKMLTPAFHFRIFEEFVSVFNEQSKILTKKLMKTTTKESIDIFPLVTMCTLDIICDSVMGCHINAQENTESSYVLALEKIKNIIHRRQFRFFLWPEWIFNLTPIGREHNKCLKILHGFTDKVIQERKIKFKSGINLNLNQQDNSISRKKRLAFLDLLIEASDDGRRLNDIDIREEVDTFMFEGHDTTASAITWCLYLLAKFPHFQKNVQEELDNIFGDDKSMYVTSEHLIEMKYLDCVIKEAMRIFPPVPIISRTLAKDIKIDDHVVPAGTDVILNIVLLHRDPKVFQNPELFDPERFLPENSLNRHPFSYIPFSAGSRNCIGQKLAAIEVKVVLSWILRTFEIKSMQNFDNFGVLAELILRPQNGIIVSLKPR